MGAVRLGLQETARHVDRRPGPDLLVLFERLPEVDPFGVAEEPGAIVVLTTLERGDANGDIGCGTGDRDAGREVGKP